MDSTQIHALISGDPYLKKLQCYILFEDELPNFIEPGSVYFVLISNGRTKVTDKGTYDLGHWILIEFLKDKNFKGPNAHQLSFFDPYGNRPSKDTLKKLKGSAKFMQCHLYVNTTCIQTVSSLCGIYSTYIGLLRARGFSYKTILKGKLSKRSRVNIRVLPELIGSLLPRRNRTIERFSLDFVV